MTTSARFTRRNKSARKQEGFALLLVIFLATLMLLSAMAVAPSIRTENQREKEQEMIWRGRQYIRGIKLFYRKNARFPTSLEDLTKPKLGSIRFMRKAYKDPLNKEDGSWRLIYVGPAGQLIGSLKPPQTLQLPGVAAAGLAGSGATAAGFGQSTLGAGSASATSGFGQAATQAGSQVGTQGATPQSGSTGTPQSTSAAGDDSASLSAAGISSDNPIVGGNIIGVGSKVNKRSVIVYDKATNYRLFEFVWNPSKDMANAIGQGVQGGAPNGTAQPAQGQGTGSGFGQQPNNPANPTSTPQPSPAAPPQPQL